MKQNKDDKAFTAVNRAIMIFVLLVSLYPFCYVLALSFNSDFDFPSRNVWLFPGVFSTGAYLRVFQNDTLLSAFWVSVRRTVLAAVLGVTLNSFMGYAISKKYLIGRRFFIIFVTVTMYISGGLIPWFLMMRNLHLRGNIWGLVIPNLFSAFYVIILRSFFEQIPESLEESAKIDGANDAVVFFRIVVQMSTPVLATIALFIGVAHWNDWFLGEVLMTKSNQIPLQTLLLRVIFMQQASLLVNVGGVIKTSSESVKMAAIIISTVPILCVYPFLQRYFVKGILLGAVKG